MMFLTDSRYCKSPVQNNPAPHCRGVVHVASLRFSRNFEKVGSAEGSLIMISLTKMPEIPGNAASCDVLCKGMTFDTVDTACSN